MCLICKNCAKLIDKLDQKCPSCKETINSTKILDISIYENYKKISYLFDDDDSIIEEVLEAQRIENHCQMNYINDLIKSDELKKEENRNIEFRLSQMVKKCNDLQDEYNDNISIYNQLLDQYNMMNDNNQQ